MYYLYLESFAFLWHNDEKVLVYNTLNSKSIEFENSGIVKEKVELLGDAKNLYFVELSDVEMGDDKLVKFISQIKNIFAGNIVKKSDLGSKPVHIPPKLKLKIYRRMQSNGDVINQKISENLRGVVIYITGECDQGCELCEVQYRQVLFCKKSNLEISFEDLERVVLQIESSLLSTVNIVGGNIFKYSQWENLLKLIDESNLTFNMYNHKNNIPSTSELRKLSKSNIMFNVLLDEIGEGEFISLVDRFDEADVNRRYIFVVKTISDYAKISNLIDRFSIKRYRILPVYDGNNLDFFRSYVFLNKSEILLSKQTRLQLFAKEIINMNNFGKIIYFSDGSVATNTNVKSIGRITEPLNRIIRNEFEFKSSWFTTRLTIDPCNSCIFKFLCSSPSNYEFFMGKYDFCTGVHKEVPCGI